MFVAPGQAELIADELFAGVELGLDERVLGGVAGGEVERSRSGCAVLNWGTSVRSTFAGEQDP
ncbi:MAG TPA: hypothetical protein VIU11_17730 [Nakamurella sp.]